MERFSERSRTPSRRIPQSHTFQGYLKNNSNLSNNDSRRQRLCSSPLKVPLQSAVNKLVTGISKKQFSPNRLLLATPGSTANSREFLPRSRFSTVDVHEDQDADILEKLHPEVMEFLKKYFTGENAKVIPTVQFVDYLTQQFSNLWTQSQAKAILPEFIDKLCHRMGHIYIDLSKLYAITKQNGLIGLILNIFRQLRTEQQGPHIQACEQDEGCAPFTSSSHSLVQTERSSTAVELQNLQNILQEYTEGLYKNMENEIYSKVNCEMRRLVMQYKEAQSLIITINDRINQNIDKLHYQKKKCELQKKYNAAVAQAEQRAKSLQAELDKEKSTVVNLQAENQKLQADNRRLTEMMEKMQNCFFKIQEAEIANKSNTNTSNIKQTSSVHPSTVQVPAPPIFTQTPNQLYVPSSLAPPVFENPAYIYQQTKGTTTGLVEQHVNYHPPLSINTMNTMSNPSSLASPKASTIPTTVNFVYGAVEAPRKGISTTLMEKQNGMQTRSATPTRIIQKITYSPNRLVKPR